MIKKYKPNSGWQTKPCLFKKKQTKTLIRLNHQFFLGGQLVSVESKISFSFSFTLSLSWWWWGNCNKNETILLGFELGVSVTIQ